MRLQVCIKRLFLLIVLLVISCGCVTTASTSGPAQSMQAMGARVERVTVGMNSGEVRAILGRPTTIRTTETQAGIQEKFIYTVFTLAENLLSKDEAFALGFAMGDRRPIAPVVITIENGLVVAIDK